jgi:hypothetical protein
MPQRPAARPSCYAAAKPRLYRTGLAPSRAVDLGLAQARSRASAFVRCRTDPACAPLHNVTTAGTVTDDRLPARPPGGAERFSDHGRACLTVAGARAGQAGRGDTMRTALVLSGGGNLGVVQIAFIEALFARVRPDLIVGTSVGTLNGALLAADPCPGDGGRSHRPRHGPVGRLLSRHLRRRSRGRGVAAHGLSSARNAQGPWACAQASALARPTACQIYRL